MKPELLHQTQQLLKALRGLLIHVFLYLVFNIGLLLFVFDNMSQRWGFLFIIVLWAILLIIHGIQVYGKDPSKSAGPKLLMYVLKLSGI